MKANRCVEKTGERLTIFRINFAITRDYIIKEILYYLDMNKYCESKTPITTKLIENGIRSRLYARGFYFYDDVEYYKRLWSEAVKICDVLFPDFINENKKQIKS